MDFLNIEIVAVIPKGDEKYFNLESDRGEILDCDYAQTAIIVNNEIVYWNDNIHGNPDDYIRGFLKSLELSKVKYDKKEVIKYAKDLEILKGVKY